MKIKNFMGGKLASWMMSLSNLKKIRLSYCEECEEVPPLGHLPNLRHVKFEHMYKLKCVGVEFYGVALFPSLKTLVSNNCPALIEWKEAAFPCLEELTLLNCRELRNAPSRFPSLQKLKICNIDQVMAIENICSQLTTLTHLEIRGATELTRLPVGMLENNHNLRVMHIDDCNKLSHLPDGLHALRLRIVKIQNCEKLSSWPSGLKYCTSLQELHITNCQNLRHLPVDALQNPVSLKELYIVDCTNLEAVPSLDNLTSLHDVTICGCDGLTSLPRGLQSCTSLNRLTIIECHNLISMADVDVSRLQSLSNLEIFDCQKLKYLPTGLRSLTSLHYMRIGKFWEQLDSFPDFELPSQIRWLNISGWPKLKSLPQQIQHFTCLEYLFIKSFDSMEALPEWLGNLTSLIYLYIWDCKNLMYLPTVEVMQRLTKLGTLVISGCPLLAERCAKESGPEWHKISHIPDIRVAPREESESSSDDSTQIIN